MKLYSLLIFLIFSANTIYAESDISALSILLNTEISGASKYDQTLIESPSQATVIPDEDIRKRGARTIGEALQTTNGIYISNQRDYSHIGIRGVLPMGDYNTRFLLLNDGVRLNDPLYDSALIGHESPLDINWIKKIEYISGPNSSLYGGNAILGTANVITYSGSDINGSKISVESQSDNRYKTTFISGQQLSDGNDYVVGLSIGGGAGPNLYFPSQGWAQKLDGENYLKGYLKANISQWSINAGLSHRNKDIPTGYWGTVFNESGTYNNDDHQYINISRQDDLTNNLSQLVRFRYGQYQYSGHYNYGSYQTSDWGQSQWYGLDYSANYRGIENHRINGGIEIQENAKLILGASNGLNNKTSYLNYSTYIQDQWTLSSTWIQYLGIRLDKINEQTAISPKWSIVHRASENTVIRLSAGQAFRPANHYEKFYTDNNSSPGYLTSNPALKNEYIRNTEINIDQALTTGLLASLSIYHFELKNHIEQTTNADQLLQFTNNGNMLGNGIELTTRYQSNNLKIQTGFAYQTLKNNSNPATNSPHITGKLLIEDQIPSSNFIISLNVLTTSNAYNSNYEKLSGYTTSNLTLTQNKFNEYGRLSLGIYNLFNRKYLVPNQPSMLGQGIYQDQRIARVKWEFKF